MRGIGQATLIPSWIAIKVVKESGVGPEHMAQGFEGSGDTNISGLAAGNLW